MTKLVIVESPSKAKTIEKYLGDEYKVVASVGHVRDLPKSNKNAIDIEGGFIPHYEVSKGKEKVITELKKLAKNADEVILATDPDREGEAIAWHVAEVLGLKKPERVAFNEITKDVVQDAMMHTRPIDEKLVKAQEARRVLDRLVGYDLSGLIWKKVRYGLSAGRVQSPALRILMEREREIGRFVPEPYWVLTAHTETAAKEILTLIAREEPKTESGAEDILKRARNSAWKVADVKETQQKRAPRAPFTTSTLQQTASTRLGFSPSRTMRAAQKLYEAGLITYMRTDSTTLSPAALAEIDTTVAKEYGENLVTRRAYKTKSKNAQEAHEAIRPTKSAKMRAGTTDDQKRLYELVRARTLASQMADAQVMRTKITVSFDDTNIPDFSASGSRVVFPGWLLADLPARGEDVELPKVAPGDALALKNITSERKETQPPQRYSEAGLIKELEKRGIGRPSTYASIIDTLRRREYVDPENRSLIPTATGDVVSSFLENHFGEYISDSFTSEMETELDDIATGDREYTKTLKDFYAPFHKAVASKEDIEKLTNLGDAPKEFPCPKCGKHMVMKLGKNGVFMSCSNFPECDGARTEEGLEIKPDEPIGRHPETGEDIFVMNGRFGPYVQLGQNPEKGEKKKRGAPKPRRASVPKEVDPGTVTVTNAVKWLSLPRTLGAHPETGSEIMANIGRFGPYIAHDIEPKPDFRSLKGDDDPYTITLERALAILKEPKKVGRGRFAKKK